jgi:hypothetical protein
VRGAVVVLSYPVVLPFRWFVYPVTYLRVAVGGFVLELPLLVHLVLPEFERETLEYPVFAVFESSLLVFISALLDPLAHCLPLLLVPSFFRAHSPCGLLSLDSSRFHDLTPFSLRTLLALLLRRSHLLFLLVRFAPFTLPLFALLAFVLRFNSRHGGDCYYSVRCGGVRIYGRGCGKSDRDWDRSWCWLSCNVACGFYVIEWFRGGFGLVCSWGSTSVSG